MREVLEELNHRIALRKDRDHQIGHSYFMKVDSPESFAGVFRDHVLPLLQEYFYNDWEGLSYVLGDEARDDGAFVRRVQGGGTKWVRNRWEWALDGTLSAHALLGTLAKNYKLTGETDGE